MHTPSSLKLKRSEWLDWIPQPCPGHHMDGQPPGFGHPAAVGCTTGGGSEPWYPKPCDHLKNDHNRLSWTVSDPILRGYFDQLATILSSLKMYVPSCTRHLKKLMKIHLAKANHGLPHLVILGWFPTMVYKLWWFMTIIVFLHIYIYITDIPVVPHKAVAEVSKTGNL